MLVSGVVLFQLALHLVYGEETFLYSLHWIAPLVILASFALKTRFKTLVMAGVLVLIAGSLVLNLQAFDSATAHVLAQRSERDILFSEMRARPDDAWPRGDAHVVLGDPGAPIAQKAYLEPGGAFSPAPGSFGLDVWMRNGDRFTPASSLPLSEIEQSFRFIEGKRIPSVVTRTPSFESEISWQGEQRWRVDINQRRTAADEAISLMLRSVGPAGGPVKHLQWREGHLIINDEWTVRFSPTPRTVVIGDERHQPLSTQMPAQDEWRNGDGWGYARLDFAADSVVVDLERLSSLNASAGNASNADPSLPDSAVRSFNWHIPDARFTASLNAQAAHLLMGLEGNETRPGDPIEYGLQWQRDGAFVVVALASAGYVELAKRLSHEFAVKDFFGGFGTEADAPGLALWVMNEVAMRAQDKTFEQSLWPDVLRKVALIRDCLDASGPVRRAFSGKRYPDRATTQIWFAWRRGAD